MELAAHWHKCQNLPKKRVNTLLLYRERDDPVKERLANWRTRSGTLGSVEERYTGALHGRTSKILATWQIDSYPRQADAYLCLKRAIYRRFEHKIGRISCPTFRGKGLLRKCSPGSIIRYCSLAIVICFHVQLHSSRLLAIATIPTTLLTSEAQSRADNGSGAMRLRTR